MVVPASLDLPVAQEARDRQDVMVTRAGQDLMDAQDPRVLLVESAFREVREFLVQQDPLVREEVLEGLEGLVGMEGLEIEVFLDLRDLRAHLEDQDGMEDLDKAVDLEEWEQVVGLEDLVVMVDQEVLELRETMEDPGDKVHLDQLGPQADPEVLAYQDPMGDLDLMDLKELLEDLDSLEDLGLKETPEVKDPMEILDHLVDLAEPV